MSRLKVYAIEDGCMPQRGYKTDAGLDLKSRYHYTLIPGEVQMIATGVHVEIPEGYVGLIFPRSGLATKHGIRLANTVGVIDSDYRGEIMCAMETRSMGAIGKGDRIAQLVVLPIMLEYERVHNFNQLSKTSRGSGGFGSTG